MCFDLTDGKSILGGMEDELKAKVLTGAQSLDPRAEEVKRVLWSGKPQVVGVGGRVEPRQQQAHLQGRAAEGQGASSEIRRQTAETRKVKDLWGILSPLSEPRCV